MGYPRICLASKSPRRAELLDQIGLQYEVVPAPVDETPGEGEEPDTFVCRVAREKALAVASTREFDLVIGADTAVVVDGEIFGKPDGPARARTMLERLSGRTHRVLSAVAVADGQRDAVRLSESRVTFRSIASGEIDAYWASGEPADKAGGYAIQGLGAVFVRHLEGSYSGVMGLPLFETAGLLGEWNVPVLATDIGANESTGS